MKFWHVLFLCITILAAAAIMQMLPRYQFYTTPNGVTYTYDKWNNNVLMCYASGCQKAEGDLVFRSVSPGERTAK